MLDILPNKRIYSLVFSSRRLKNLRFPKNNSLNHKAILTFFVGRVRIKIQQKRFNSIIRRIVDLFTGS